MSECRDKSGRLEGRREILRKSLLGGVALTGAAMAGLPTEAFAADTSSDLPSATVRRVVTGNNAQGNSMVIMDEMLKRGAEMWHTDANEPLGTGLPEDTHSLLPTVGKDLPPGGTRAFFFTIQPSKGPFDRAAIKAWERTASIVYVLFLNGPITYVLDENEVTFRAGDVLIQRNAKHTWHNPTDTPVTALAVIVRV